MKDTAMLEHELKTPDEATARQAAQAAAQLDRLLRNCPDVPAVSVSLAGGDGTVGDGTVLDIPCTALRLLVGVLAEIADGNAVTVVPVRTELTTQQAADLLNVSRPYLVKLLDERKIPHRRVGNRRRVLLADLFDYKHRDEADRRAIADELTAEAQNLGLDY